MNSMEATREWYRIGASLAPTRWRHYADLNHRFYLLLEAAAVAADMATAEHNAGRAPRGWWARQVPG